MYYQHHRVLNEVMIFLLRYKFELKLMTKGMASQHLCQSCEKIEGTSYPHPNHGLRQ